MATSFEWQWDSTTLGLALFYVKGVDDIEAPEFLKRSSITIVFGWWVGVISWQ